MQRAFALITLGAALALASAPLLARGNAADGKTKAAACFACHGADGNGVDPQYPRLAGQYDGYLVQVLHEYKSGKRSNPIMKGMVATLSDQDVEDVAAYFSGLPTKLDTLKGHVQGD
ncbi:MAG: cytochrome c [Rhodanobacter sp.]|nr:MAG: cytochrome c [Rhodanobacter sp.]TAM10369.1 MAG: cytochrome c [Rhodanobacter sp.]TAM34467.1 MAG: cytochrome c [Rhodanobacter sp.]